jgi:hypothetical protein
MAAGSRKYAERYIENSQLGPEAINYMFLFEPIDFLNSEQRNKTNREQSSRARTQKKKETKRKVTG